MASGYSLLQLLGSAPRAVLDEITNGALTLLEEMGCLPAESELPGLVLKIVDGAQVLSDPPNLTCPLLRYHLLC
jgi:hypothetical protein